MWFDILKNEMRTINLPKFKVKPFDVNKPDEDKDDCKDRMFALQNKIKNTPLYDDNSIFDKIRDSMNEEETEHFRITKEPSPKHYTQIHGPDRYVSQFYLYPITAKNRSIQDDTKKDKFIITIEESRYTMNKQAEKIPEEVYCRALDLIAQKSTVVNGGSFVQEPYRVGDWEIHYDPRDYYGAGNYGYAKWSGLSKRKGLHIFSSKYPYQFHMSNSITVDVQEDGDGVSQYFGIAAVLDEILEHYNDIEFKWN